MVHHQDPHPLFASPQIPPTQRLRPSLLLLLLPQILHRLWIQGSCIAPLSAVDSLFARHVTDTAEDTVAGESAANTFCDSALDGVDVFIACHVGGELI